MVNQVVNQLENLKDGHGRVHNYLRISLTERCNLRCTYCMPETGVELQPSSNYMQADEILKLATLFSELGVNRIRLTGGEPLVRKDFPEIARGLTKLPVSLSMTSNGVLIDRHIELLEETGIKDINISLDTLKRDRFFHIAKRDDFDKVMSNIKLLIARGFNIKINAVLIRNFNDNEILDFVEWSRHIKAEVRFIEFMPFNGNHWAWKEIFPFAKVMELAHENYELEKVEDGPNSTSKIYRVKDGIGTFGMIASMTNPFCDTCNRIRLTSDGKIRNCLFSESESDLLGPMRRGEDVEALIRASIDKKHAKHGGIAAISKLSETDFQGRSMIRIGG
ncbi:MAG: molybdenum cofactor biosynthesis protein A [Limisphaerales bacterium]|jgi:molybdenum cofactor biosynthesis protein A